MAENLATILVIVGVGLIIGVYVFSALSTSLGNTDITNQSIGLLNTTSNANTLCVDNPPIAPGSTLTVYNASSAVNNQNTLTLTTDYTYVESSGCITNVTEVEFIRASYTSGSLSIAASATTTTMETSTYSAFQLAAILMIVIAAAAILRSLGMLGT